MESNEEKKAEEKNEETEKKKEEEKTKNKEGTEENKEEKTKPIVTPLSLDSKKKVFAEEDDDDALSIQGPLDMDKLSYTKLMEIATTMKSWAKKKRMKEQWKEAETIRRLVDILSSLLPNSDTGSFATPIDKLGQLVSDVGEKMKSLEDATYITVEKN